MVELSGGIPDHSVPGASLALSGGGYRAMVFHAGTLVRLNEAGLLPKLKMISSVSGGSITAGALAMAWPRLQFRGGVAQNFSTFIDGIRAVADTTIDAGAILGGILLPGDVNGRVSGAYDRLLFQGKTLQDLPEPQEGSTPVFTFNATNVQTGSLWRFTRAHMADYQVGMVRDPDLPLCQVVAASSAFPPVLSPANLSVIQPVEPLVGATLNRPPFTTQPVLSDGGVYDNMGLESLKRFATVLVSDAGAKIKPDETPHSDWARHSMRVLDIIDNQVRSLRKRYLIGGYLRGDLTGCYFGIRTDVSDYAGISDPLGTRSLDPAPLAEIPTRLQAMAREQQDRLMNWGYAVCDAALRCHIAPGLQTALGITLQPPAAFPFPGAY